MGMPIFLVVVMICLAAVTAQRVSASPVLVASSATFVFTATPTESASNGPPLSLTLMLAFTGCAVSLVIGVLVLGFILATQSRSAKPKEQA